MENKTKIARTPRAIAILLGVQISRVRHILRTRQHIRPIGAADHIPLYPAEAVAQVRHELNAQDARRTKRSEAAQ